MNKKTLFLISAFTLSLTTVLSQTEPSLKRNSLEFSTGYNSGSLVNLEFAPVSRYDYNSLVYKLNYEHTSKKKNVFQIQLDYLNSELKSDAIPQLNSNYSKTGLDFSYLKQVYNKSAFSIHLGLQSQTTLSLYSNDYFIAEQEFGIASRFKYQLNEKQYLTSKLTIPVVLFRITLNTDFNTSSLNRYQSVLWNLEYGYSLSTSFDLRLNYNFNYQRLQISNAFRELQHQLNLGINYKF